MEILGTTLRVCVDDLDRTVPFYERLVGRPAERFDRGNVSVAAVGCFLLMSGPAAEIEVLRQVRATLAVPDVEEAAARPARTAGTIVTDEGEGGRQVAEFLAGQKFI